MLKYIICAWITLLIFSCDSEVKENQSTQINWEGNLNLETFERAKKENKVILLNLEANWCHWCHVMHDSTYSNTDVINYINEHFIPIKADQDATPELANRYRKFGWPATIFINSEGEDLVKRAGYINRLKFMSLLKSIVKSPIPEKENSSLAKLEITNSSENKTIEKLNQNLKKAFDYKIGGYNSSHKYLDYESFEYALLYSENPKYKEWARKTIEGAKQLSDPSWGGIYQYSTYRTWNNIHYEKLLSVQARHLKAFSQSYTYFNDSTSLIYAEATLSYSDRFLKSADGLYGNAQDADLVKGVHSDSYFELSDKERIKLGIPKVDTNTYTANNAAMISSLLMLYYTTEKDVYKVKYEAILKQLLKRKNKDGLYYHSLKEAKVISLKDNLSMASAFISLSRNKNNQYEKELASLMASIKSNFILDNGSFKSFSGNIGLKANPLVSENIIAARLFNWYGHYCSDESYLKIAKRTYQFLITPKVATTYYVEPGILSLQKEINTEPKQFVTLVIEESNLSFTNKAKAMAPFYSIIKTYKPKELPEDKKELFEGFGENIILVCTSSYCSSPIYDEEGVLEFFIK